ncbi:hypothetical protein SAMN05216214_112106 [Atopomonas hussainii]|uniref:Uncharacterized protein n=1 Tax=Atopomonas hussainii TaxID=1429083 RepID=A0A1H7QBW2_9GAMM|nr:hypothetical protein [Atopomonas hussainii]SEL45600.1 hypothetical protein SAMN05216214_112106 [Atopomonas hussainii]
MSAALRSSLRIHRRQLAAVLQALDYQPDEDFSLAHNVCDCLSDYHWYAAAPQDEWLSFEFASDDDEQMDWEVLLTLTPFLEEGSYYEERAGDYVLDAQGQQRTGLIRAWVEQGQLKGMIYALVPDPTGSAVREPVAALDPRMI